MKSEWKVYSNVIGDEKQYIVGRQLDTSKPLHEPPKNNEPAPSANGTSSKQ